MPRKEYMKPEELREILDYDPLTGWLTWKERGAHLFKDGYRSAQGEANNWNKKYSGHRAGYVAPIGYRYIGLPGPNRVPEHRVIWAMEYGEWPDVIDHIDGDKLNNRLENFRNCSQLENGKNSVMWAHNKSGVTGVCFTSREQSWLATIKVGQKNIYLCRTNSFEEAVRVRRAAEISYGFTARHGI